jgi:CheY-like chemotaxis protein
MPIVLAIEPDLRQAAIIKRIVRDKIHADVVVVDSRDAALDAIRTSIPDVLLLSALLSPRDEDELIAHLRLLDGAEHLQTHTIPQLASTSGDRESGRGRGLLGMFSRK